LTTALTFASPRFRRRYTNKPFDEMREGDFRHIYMSLAKDLGEVFLPR
jgi:hypothetical protein